MFDEFDKYIKDFEAEDFAGDYWYDEGILIAGDMLQKFEDSDWDLLKQALPERSNGWKCRLAYCLDEPDDRRQSEILLELADTDDTELFITAVDALRCFKDRNSIIKNNDKIKQKIEKLVPEAGMATKKILQDFLKPQGGEL